MSTCSSIEALSNPEEGWEVKTPPQKSPTIEIERKFIVPEDYHEKLLAHGFSRENVYDEVLVDKYYDTCEYALLKKDHWLRQRNGDWELKYPVGLHDKAQCVRFAKNSRTFHHRDILAPGHISAKTNKRQDISAPRHFRTETFQR